MGKLLSQSFEGGPFDYGVRRAAVKCPSLRDAEQALPSSCEEPLSVSSLCGYFLLWLPGIIVSSVALVPESLVSTLRVRRRDSCLVRCNKESEVCLRRQISGAP